MEKIDKFEEQMKNVKDWLKRNAILLVIGIIMYFVSPPDTAELTTLVIIARMMLLSIVLAGVAQYAYTHVDFLTEDKPALGRIFQGTCLLVGLSVLGIYIAQIGG